MADEASQEQYVSLYSLQKQLTALAIVTSRIDDHITVLQTQMNRLIALLGQGKHGETVMAVLDALTAQVAATLGAEQAAVADILALSQAITAALAKPTVDPAALADLVGKLQTSAQALAAATAGNQPPPPTP